MSSGKMACKNISTALPVDPGKGFFRLMEKHPSLKGYFWRDG
jgi:hypothetical protein